MVSFCSIQDSHEAMVWTDPCRRYRGNWLLIIGGAHAQLQFPQMLQVQLLNMNDFWASCMHCLCNVFCGDALNTQCRWFQLRSLRSKLSQEISLDSYHVKLKWWSKKEKKIDFPRRSKKKGLTIRKNGARQQRMLPLKPWSGWIPSAICNPILPVISCKCFVQRLETSAQQITQTDANPNENKFVK